MSDPDQIRRDIEATRHHLEGDVDALSDKVSPHNIAERQKEKVRSRVTDVRESIMGGVRTAQDRVGDAGGGASGAASSAVDTAKGHPLVVGLVAFGAGWLLSSLLPSTRSEQDLASRAKDRAAPLTDKVKETAKNAGQEVAQNLKAPAQDAAQHVKGTAQDAASTVQDEGRSAAQDVRGQAQDARGAVQDRASDAKDELQDQAQQVRRSAQP